MYAEKNVFFTTSEGESELHDDSDAKEKSDIKWQPGTARVLGKCENCGKSIPPSIHLYSNCYTKQAREGERKIRE